MISIARLNARGANANGDAVVDYLMATEYYLDKEGQQQETMRWGGKLAGELELAGKPVDKQDMLMLARGFAPDGRPLCRNAGAEPREIVKRDRQGNARLDKDGNPITRLEGGHRVGFDLTFSAPKPVSVAFALAQGEERDALLEAHRRAVKVGLDYLEGKVETRRGEAGRDVIGARGLIYSQHDHLSNRNLEPNLHTHNLVYGVAQGEDGQWGTFDAIELYRHRMAADVVYKNELAANLQQLGYGIRTERELDEDGQETGQVLYRIAGIDDALCEAFSTRRQEILDYQAEHGVDAQTACLATRRHKDEPSYPEMTAMWDAAMRKIEGVPTIAQLKAQGSDLAGPAAPAEILERLHRSEAVIADHQLIERLGLEYAGQVRFDGLLEKVEAFKQEAGLVRVGAERLAEEDRGTRLSRRHTEDRFAAPWMVEWEREVVHRVASRETEDHQKVAPDVLERAVADYEQRNGFALSAEQREAVAHITTGTGGVAVLSGLAGTGKTTVAQCYADAFKASGRRMLGVCVSNAAAKKLEAESGMPCMSVAKMLSRLEREKIEFTGRDVLVVDEAGMIDTDHTRRLLAHAQRVGAKVVLQGDTQQLQPIGAGSGMSLAKMAAQDVKLTEIRRQAHVEDREIALAFYNPDGQGKVEDLRKGTRSRREGVAIGQAIVAALDKRGSIDAFDTKEQAVGALVADYLGSRVPLDDKLVLGHSRAEVATLNARIRAGLKQRGTIAPREVEFHAKEAGKAHTMAVSCGDRVRFTAANENLGVVNGTAARVLSARANPEGGVDLKVRVRSDIAKEDGRVLTFNTRECNALAHNYASTVHKAQGQGKAHVYHLANLSMLDNHSALVAFTRLTKGRYTLYGADEDIERLAERLGLERLKGTALDAGVKQKPEPGLDAHTAALVDAARARLRQAQVLGAQPRQGM